MTLEQPAPIVAGVDGSPSSVVALRYAATLAHALGAPLEVVTAWTSPPLVPRLAIEWSPDQEARELLDASIYEAFGDDPPAGITSAVLPGSPARSLIELSARCAMLVLGTRGHGGFVGLLLGSVSAACVAHAHCPVLIVRDEEPETGDVTASIDT